MPKLNFFRKSLLIFLLSSLFFSLQAREYLVSWNDGKTKEEIVAFVQNATNPQNPFYIPAKDRIAVFDNDGTLWSERPLYFQLYYVFDKVKELHAKNPEWSHTQPFQAVLENDMKSLATFGVKGLLQLVAATHSGSDDVAYKEDVKQWLSHTKHPTLKRPYTDLIFQPMMELITYLEANGFQIYIVSGGGIDFMRAFIPELYGIKEQNIVGSSVEVRYEKGKIIKEPKIHFIDDKETKPVAIYRHIGKHPVAAFGNSDGDLAMMQYTQNHPTYKTLQLYVHHTDSKREFKYDRSSHIGKLDKGLDYGRKHKWSFADMENDWRVVYPYQLGK
jgi:phosphoserine phosphatase